MFVSDQSGRRATPLGDGRFEVIDGATRQTAFAVRRGAETWVFLDGRVFVLGEPSRSSTRGTHSSADDEAALAAPMPATVVAINVQPGDAVARGDVLMTLEAMKMELAIRAPRGGTIRRLACKPGELVQAGVPLLEIE